MTAFDADVLTLIFRGDRSYIQKLALIPPDERSVPIVVVDQILRGRLHSIRQAETGKAKASIEVAYAFLEQTLADLKWMQILSYSAQAESLVQSWRKQKIKVGVSDMRIAATSIVHSAKLVSRNRRDFDLVPGLSVEYW
jgi:tRNA(fMet)-specific endonuclease VapC